MVVGLKYGRSSVDDVEAKKKSYGVSGELLKRFREKCGSVSCSDLLGCDLNTEEGLKTARDNNLFRTVCPKYVKSAAELLEDLL